MAAFHQTTQRLAVGTVTGIVILYDLRTATKWRILQGHGGPISAVAFSAGGEFVASYSAADGTLRWWQAGSTSILGYFGLHGHCSKVARVVLPAEPAADAEGAAPPTAAEPGGAGSARGPPGVSLEWTSPSTVMLLGGRAGKPLGFYSL